MPGSTSDLCGIRSSLWRCLALALASRGPIGTGKIYKVLKDMGVSPAASTLYQAIHEMVDAGLLERGVDNGANKEKSLAITQKGREVLASVRGDLVELVALIEGQAAPARAAPPPQERDVLQDLLAVARASEAAVVELRKAMRQMKQVVDEALAGTGSTNPGPDEAQHQ